MFRSVKVPYVFFQKDSLILIEYDMNILIAIDNFPLNKKHIWNSVCDYDNNHIISMISSIDYDGVMDELMKFHNIKKFHTINRIFIRILLN